MVGLRAKRSRTTPCASLQRDVSAQVSTAVSVPTAENSSSTQNIPTIPSSQPQAQSKPYRVTNETIKDIKDYHKSQLCEYDYVVDDSMVSNCHKDSVAQSF